MKRVVYAPKISAYVKADSGIYDLTEFITEFSIDRKINQISSAEITIRNPHKVWTNRHYKDSITGESKIGPIFHPMDPITIFLQRLEGRPVQVFTGYCDSTPYLQLFPEPVTIKASCTLKRLLYTYFDPGLPFTMEYLKEHGWSPAPGGTGIVNPSAENANIKKNPKQKEQNNTKLAEGVQYGDSGIGELLFHVLVDIGKWPEEAIFIQEIPPQVIELVSNLFEIFKAEGEEGQEELESFLSEIIGKVEATGGGSEGEGVPAEGGTIEGISSAYQAFCKLVNAGTGLSLRVLGAWCLAEGGPSYNPLNIGPGNVYPNIKGGANATIETLKGSLYKNVLAAVGKSDSEQIKAIVASPWCPGCAGYEELLFGTYAQVSIVPQAGEEKHHPTIK